MVFLCHHFSTLSFFVDTLIFKVFGNTLGKFLLNIKIVDESGQKPSFKTYWRRNLQVWSKGFALGIPLLNLITFVVQYIRLGKNNLTRYDEALGTRPIAAPLTWWKVTLFVPMFAIMTVGISILNQMQDNQTIKPSSSSLESPVKYVLPSAMKEEKENIFTPDFSAGIIAYEQKDYATALQHFQQLAEQGHADAQFNLGKMYAKGEGVVEDQKQAGDWFKKAAEQGQVNAQFLLGLTYAIGEHVAEDQKQAVEWYKKAAEQGHAEAQYLLGTSYYKGKGIVKDVKQAVEWYRRSAEQGLADAQYKLGLMYFDGEGIAKDSKQAVDWFRKAADQGNSFAQRGLGIIYITGTGVEKNPKQAFEWFRKSGEQGNSSAQYQVGLMYAEGNGVAKDTKQANEWYRKAAEQGNSSAQNNLGFMYANGYGVAKDLVVAYHWYNLSASAGEELAVKNRNNLELRLTPTQISQAQEMTREYLANRDKPKPDTVTEPAKPKTITGTAFLVNKQGYLLTNAHVINQCQTIKVYSENTTHSAQLIARDAINDMAILKTQLWSDAKPISFSKKSVSLGQDIYAIGYPLANVLALDLQMTKGNVSAVAGLGNDSRFYQISAPVQSGNSGGPLVNAYGLVSGMVTSKTNIVKMKQLTGDFPQNINFALKENQLKNYLDTNGVTYLTSSNDDELKGEQIASQAIKYTVLVECVK